MTVPGKPPVLENWTESGSVRVNREGNSFTADSYYSWGSARATVKVPIKIASFVNTYDAGSQGQVVL